MTQEKLINLAAISNGSTALGPGKRAVIWVQGCPFSCEGCISKDWRSFRSNELVSVDELAEKMVIIPEINGLTLSGGEPFAQAEALAAFLKIVKSKKNLNIICFTGYEFKDLISQLEKPGFKELLGQIDLLIDGPFEQDLTLIKGLRGSSNQRFFHLSNQLIDFNPAEMERNLEILVQPGSLMLVGIPSSRDLACFEKTVSRVNQELVQTGLAQQGLQV
jgi:anaerobic ribonucleoside-triphosphate reductase activating protein